MFTYWQQHFSRWYALLFAFDRAIDNFIYWFAVDFAQTFQTAEWARTRCFCVCKNSIRCRGKWNGIQLPTHTVNNQHNRLADVIYCYRCDLIENCDFQCCCFVFENAWINIAPIGQWKVFLFFSLFRNSTSTTIYYLVHQSIREELFDGLLTCVIRVMPI